MNVILFHFFQNKLVTLPLSLFIIIMSYFMIINSLKKKFLNSSQSLIFLNPILGVPQYFKMYEMLINLDKSSFFYVSEQASFFLNEIR